MSWRDEFPHLYELYQASERAHSDNYFSVIEAPRSELASASYQVWDDCLARLDPQSLTKLLTRAAPYVARRDTRGGRHWTALFEVLNEAKGYEYLLDEGYTKVRFIDRMSRRTPDIRGEAAFGTALCEVKTVNISEEDIAEHGTVQTGYYGIPVGLQRQLSSVYDTARDQLWSIDLSAPVRRICFFSISLDLSVALVASNKEKLDAFLTSIRKDCEIYHESRYWSN